MHHLYLYWPRCSLSTIRYEKGNDRCPLDGVNLSAIERCHFSEIISSPPRPSPSQPPKWKKPTRQGVHKNTKQNKTTLTFKETKKMAAFSSDVHRCLEQQVELNNVCPTPLDNLRGIYALDRCDYWIKSNRLSKLSNRYTKESSIQVMSPSKLQSLVQMFHLIPASVIEPLFF